VNEAARDRDRRFMAAALALGGQHAVPAAATAAGYEFEYGNIDDALRAELSAE